MADHIKEAIYQYIAANSGNRLTSTEVIAHFGLRIDKVLIPLYELEAEGRIYKAGSIMDGFNGNYHYRITEGSDGNLD
jgi:predicted Rossmann fold nucleotide-binding protein DprA/Smf involved in DNA uptake